MSTQPAGDAIRLANINVANVVGALIKEVMQDLVDEKFIPNVNTAPTTGAVHLRLLEKVYNLAGTSRNQKEEGKRTRLLWELKNTILTVACSHVMLVAWEGRHYKFGPTPRSAHIDIVIQLMEKVRQRNAVLNQSIYKQQPRDGERAYGRHYHERTLADESPAFLHFEGFVVYSTDGKENLEWAQEDTAFERILNGPTYKTLKARNQRVEHEIKRQELSITDLINSHTVFDPTTVAPSVAPTERTSLTTGWSPTAAAPSNAAVAHMLASPESVSTPGAVPMPDAVPVGASQAQTPISQLPPPPPPGAVRG